MSLLLIWMSKEKVIAWNVTFQVIYLFILETVTLQVEWKKM